MSSDPYMDRIEEIMAPHPVYGLGWQGDDAEQRAFVRHVYGQAGLDAFLAGGTMALNEFERGRRDTIPEQDARVY
jgi:hypothetical protein